jgi:hypothetical protein
MLSTMPKRRLSGSRRSSLTVALSVFILRALIPIGFMPGSIEAGTPIVICHGGLAGAFFAGLAAGKAAPTSAPEMAPHAAAAMHASMPMADHMAGMPPGHPEHSGDSSNPAHEGWDHCPFGAAFGTAALHHNFGFHLLTLDNSLVAIEPRFPIPAAFTSSYQARAPPQAPFPHLI